MKKKIMATYLICKNQSNGIDYADLKEHLDLHVFVDNP